jgi:hypothetical protein
VDRKAKVDEQSVAEVLSDVAVVHERLRKH